jgi:hypothetical protein
LNKFRCSYSKIIKHRNETELLQLDETTNRGILNTSAWPSLMKPVRPLNIRLPQTKLEDIYKLATLYRYIATAASSKIAERFTDGIVTYCGGFTNFPDRGTCCRDDIQPGLCIPSYRSDMLLPSL